MKPQNLRWTVVPVLILAVTMVSCAKRLNRDAAETLVGRHASFTAPITVNLDTPGKSSRDPIYRAFAALGLVDLEYGRLQELSGGGTFPIVRLTPKGESASKGWELIQDQGAGYLGIPAKTWTVVVANRAMQGVTGVAEEPGGAEATIKFQYRYVPNEAVGNFELIDYSRIHEGSALAKLYDDGWRIERLDVP